MIKCLKNRNDKGWNLMLPKLLKNNVATCQISKVDTVLRYKTIACKLFVKFFQKVF